MESKGLQFIYQQSVASTQRYHAVFLRTVLGNLLRNAWHYTNSGQITLRVDDQGFTVEVNDRQMRTAAVLTHRLTWIRRAGEFGISAESLGNLLPWDDLPTRIPHGMPLFWRR